MIDVLSANHCDVLIKQNEKEISNEISLFPRDRTLSSHSIYSYTFELRTDIISSHIVVVRNRTSFIIEQILSRL